MAKWLHMSKAFAVAAIIMTISAIAGIIAMVIAYQTPRPTYAPTTMPPSDRPQNMRLPGNLVPTHYKLTLKPHLYTRINTTDDNSPNQTMSFTGNSTVDFHCIQKTTSIFLHSQNLTLMKVKVTDRDTDRSLPYSDIIEYKDGSDFLEIQMSNLLAEGGNYSLFVEFLGEMLEDMSGLYVSTYHEGVQDTGEDTKRYLATSQLQPTDARKVFPCFDEPALKATFEVTIIHRRGTTALGNWELLESNIVDDWLYTRFYPTRKMSTYLLAFAVSEFSSISSVHGRVKVTTHARQEAINAGHLDYANKVTGQFLTFFEDHLGIVYPLQKLDQVAVPDILASGMENWGLIMYLETSLLHDKQISPIINREWIAAVIAHELAHQWFGNLVTMKWWNDIWLNEGFAVYLADLAVDHVERDWNIKNAWVMDQLHIAFQVDCLASSHPLSSPADDIQTTDQIHELFSSITYCKGAAVLRMLEDVLTAKVFHAGIKMYLSAFQYNNTETKDLWDYLQKAVYEYGGNIKVADVMNTWTNQTGFPVITINTTDGEVYQRRFTLNQSAEYSQVWHIPIRVMSKTSEPSIVFLDTDKPVKKDEFIAKPGDWVLANINSTGFYRVNYNPENWESLLNELEGNLSRIPVLNRAQLIDDAFNLARVKLVTVTLALDSTRFLQNEKAYIPWESAIRNLDYFADMFDRTDVYGPMQVYMQKLVRPLYLFYNNYTDSSSVPTDHSHQHNQVNAITIACTSGLPECQDMATRMFKTWMKNETNNSIHPNLRSAIYCQAIAAGGQREWDFAWRMYHNQTVPTETMLLGHALSCTNKIWLLNRYLDYTLDSEKISKADVLSTIGNIARNVVGQALAWNFVRTHWTYFNEEHEIDFSFVMMDVTRRFSTNIELQELKDFQTKHSDIIDSVLEKATERTQANIQWVQENKQSVLEWFQRESQSAE